MSDEGMEGTSAPLAESALNARSARRAAGAGLELVVFIPAKDEVQWCSDALFQLLC